MRKLLFCLIILSSAACMAQDLTSKEGAPILPQAKDWSIGFDATRLIKNASFDFAASSQAIAVKYFIAPQTAYRASARIGYNDWTTKTMVEDRIARTSSVIAYPAAQPLKQNTWKRTSTAIGVSFGIEKRRGITRLQGIYGVEAAIFFSTTRDQFSYGNALNASALGPVTVEDDDAMTSAVLGGANNVVDSAMIQGVEGQARIITRKSGVSLSIGARAFIGAEYFVLPKLSLGGEFGWGLGFSTTGRTETTYESMGKGTLSSNSALSVNRTTIDGGRASHTRLDTDNSNMLGGLSASLRVNLYF